MFFSCNGSGRYVGIARMTSEVNVEKEFNYWTQDSKWPGLFDIEWIFLKDIPFKCFKTLHMMMKYFILNIFLFFCKRWRNKTYF